LRHRGAVGLRARRARASLQADARIDRSPHR
jgi:hypothetical protein